jgi:hypothetical protein
VLVFRDGDSSNLSGIRLIDINKQKHRLIKGLSTDQHLKVITVLSLFKFKMLILRGAHQRFQLFQDLSHQNENYHPQIPQSTSKRYLLLVAEPA